MFGEPIAQGSSYNVDATHCEATGLNTVGACVILVGLASEDGTAVLSDSQGNAWTPLTARVVTGPLGAVQLFYCSAPVTAGGHAFYAEGPMPSFYVWAFDGGYVSVELVGENGASSTSANTLASGSVTPAENGVLFFAAAVSDSDLQAPLGDSGWSPGGGALAAGASSDAGLLWIDGVQFALRSMFYVQSAAAAKSLTVSNWGFSSGPMAVAIAALRGVVGYIDGEPGELSCVTLTNRAPTTMAFTNIGGWNDPDSYVHGRKEPWVLDMKPIVRGLSDQAGQTKHVTFGLVLSDTDRELRGLMEYTGTKAIVNAPLVVRTVTDTARRALQPMHLEMAGFVTDHSPGDDFTFEVLGTDWFKQRLARKVGNDVEYWPTLLRKTEFPLLPEALDGMPAQMPLGKMTDAFEGLDADVDLYPKSGFDPGWIDVGYNAWDTGTFPDGTVYVRLSAIKDGVESTAYRSFSFATNMASPAFHVRLKSSVVPDKYRVVFSDNPDPAAGTYARYVDFNEADIPEGNSPYTYSLEDSVKRFALIDSPTQGSDYLALIANGTLAPSGAWPTVHVGDLTIGGISRACFLIGRGAVKLVTGVFVGGVQVTDIGSAYEIECPDFGDWTSVFTTRYLDLNGIRFTVLFATGATALNAISGSAPITVNVHGIEAIGDGTGSLLTSPARLHQWFVRNFLSADPTALPLTGWLPTAPLNPGVSGGLTLQNDASYNAVETALQARISGGYEVADGICVGCEPESGLDILAALRVAGDFDGGVDRMGRDYVSEEPNSPPADEDVLALSDVFDIAGGSFRVGVDAQQDFWNIFTFFHTRDLTGRTSAGWFYKGTSRDDWSISEAGHGVERKRQQPLNLRFLRANTAQGVATIIDVVQRKRLRWRRPSREAELQAPYLSCAATELGGVLRVDAIQGPTIDGWVGRDIRIREIGTDVDPKPGRMRRRFACYDLQPIYDGLDDSVEPTWEPTGLRSSTGVAQIQQQTNDNLAALTSMQAEIAALDGRLDSLEEGYLGDILTADPASPANMKCWMRYTAGSPGYVELRIRIAGTNHTFAEFTLP